MQRRQPMAFAWLGVRKIFRPHPLLSGKVSRRLRRGAWRIVNVRLRIKIKLNRFAKGIFRTFR
jgi:hypothetical protein